MAPYPDFPVPADEEQRLRDLEHHDLLDHPSDPHLDRILTLTANSLEVPIALISLLDAKRQWFLARRGLDVEQTPRSMAFCAHTICGDEPLIVPDALEDERFSTNPLVLEEPKIRFYAGVPLQSENGHNLGTLCVLDRTPRQLSEEQLAQLRLYAELVMREIELRHSALRCPVTGLYERALFFRIGEKEVKHARDRHTPLALIQVDIDNFRQVNNRWGHEAGDQVLLDFAGLCRQFVREGDVIARIGDEEFGLLLIDCDGDQATSIAESLRGAAAHLPGVYTHSDYRLQISGGVTCLSPSDGGFSNLFRRAARALDLAKNNGRNQITRLTDG